MTARKKNEDKKKTGRKSSYQDAFANQALKLALLGAKDEELADFFGVDVSTINRWKKKYPEFCESLKKGKDIADSNVASKLYNRAIGYDFEETHTVRKNGLVVGEKHIKKHQPADTTAAIFWLKNRQPEKWRDRKELQIGNQLGDDLESMTDEELRSIIRGEKEQSGNINTAGESGNITEETGGE